jgi:hypothetical protein
MSDTVTDTIACVGKNLLNKHKLSIGIVICPILSDTITFVSKKFAYTYDGFIRLKGTLARDFRPSFFFIKSKLLGP